MPTNVCASAAPLAAFSTPRAAAAAQSSCAPAALSAATRSSGEHASGATRVPVVHGVRVAFFVFWMRLIRIGCVRNQFRGFYGHVRNIRRLCFDRTTCALQLGQVFGSMVCEQYARRRCWMGCRRLQLVRGGSCIIKVHIFRHIQQVGRRVG